MTRDDARDADRLRVSQREVGVTAAFWTLYAVFSVADQLVRGGGFVRAAHFLVPALGTAACWIVITPFVLHIAARHGDAGGGRGRQLVLAAAAGVLASLLVGVVGRELRAERFNAPPPGDAVIPGAAGPGRAPGPPPLWLSVTNAYVLYLGVLAAGFARAYLLRYRGEREEAARLGERLASAQLESLRRQLDPHFLFNTLNLVSALVERDPRGARRMIARLSELLRFSLDGADKQEITLGQELGVVGLYLDIMQVRYEGRLEVELRIDDRAREGLLPSLVLQPLVENSFRHGVEKVRGRTRVDIEAVCVGDMLVLRVRNDTAPGVPVREAVGSAATTGTPEVGASPDASGRNGGVGLRNTISRLTQLYGDPKALTLRTLDDGRTEVEVRIPFRTKLGVTSARSETHAG